MVRRPDTNNPAVSGLVYLVFIKVGEKDVDEEEKKEKGKEGEKKTGKRKEKGRGEKETEKESGAEK